tara:strand:- start:2185 stop:2571 length:387 start_codon:yes stop_codon:yes gene_type:complete
MNNQIIGFALKLVVLVGIVFSIHLMLLDFSNIPLFSNLIVESYLINYVLALIIFSTLFYLRKKYEHLLGFVFMGGSFLKFGIFFIFFYPVFKQNGDVSTIEATTFLVPYISCLIIETFYLVKLLNNKL